MIADASFALKKRILIGDRGNPTFAFGNDMIVDDSATGVSSVDTIGNELSVDTFSFTVRVEPKMTVYGTANGVAYRLRSGWFYGIGKDDSFAEKIEAVEYGAPVWWYIYDGDVQKFFMNGFIKSIEKLSDISWKITCMSAIGLLDTKQHKGGMYNATFQTVCADVIGNTFPYTIDDSIKKVVVPGWLPYQSARENLHLLLFSVGASIVRDLNNAGRYNIQYLGADLHELDAGHLDINSSIKRDLPATRVEVIEHSFAELSSDETVTLYDNTAAATGSSNVTVIFDSPMHDLAVTGSLTISESNCNHAVVSGTGTLTGKRTTHITREVVIDNTPAGSKPRTVRVADNCLVNPLNSNNVARRLMAYYGACRRFKAKAILSIDNKAGHNFSLTPAFFGNQNAFLEKMNYRITSVVGADCDFLAGYVPCYVGNTFSHVEVLDSSLDQFIFNAAQPELIRLVVIGSGSGGSGGHGGQCGCGRVRSKTLLNPPTQNGVLYRDYDEVAGYGGMTYTEGQDVRKGGNPGTPGKAGKIFVIDLIVEGSTIISVNIPQGGEGGDGAIAEHWQSDVGELTPWIPETDPKAGKPGSDTVCTVQTQINGRSETLQYSSAKGATSASGYYDPINEVAYALPGAEGTQGGAGGLTDSNPDIDTSGRVPYVVGPGGWSGYSGNKGADVGENTGGTGGAGAKVVGSNPVTVHGQTLTFSASGGAGSGAAWGVDGNPGTAAEIIQESGMVTIVRGGSGGDGVKPLTPPAPTAGSGGTAGHGGSSGGSAGGWFRKDYAEHYDSSSKGRSGNAGNGGDGGQGGQGILLVYHSMTL